jgi:hypothetical protein
LHGGLTAALYASTMTVNWRHLVPVFAAALLVAGYAIGAYSFAHDLWPIRGLRDAKRSTLGEAGLPYRFDSLGRLSAWRDKPDIPCPAQDARTEVVLFIGQSIQSNTVGQRATSAYGDRVVSWFDDRCAVAQSPLLGSTERLGEALTPIGNIMIDRDVADRVILVPSSIGGTAISRWGAGGDLNAMLAGVVDGIEKQYRITRVIWHQGEDDFARGTSEAAYSRGLAEVVATLRAHGVEAPIYVSVATRCDDHPNWRPDNPISRAQRAAPTQLRGVRPGVDTDALLDPLDRYDDCHLAASGAAKYADAVARLFQR